MDANQRLGFDADERWFLPAARMLQKLGFGRVRLLTSNPEKVSSTSGLRHRGDGAGTAQIPDQCP